MNPISKQTEDKLLSALQKISALVDSGVAPEDAIMAVSKEASLTPGLIRLTCHAYNTGQFEAQRKSASTAEDKLAEFAVADAERIISRMYPSIASEKGAEVSTDYAMPPVWTASENDKRRRQLAEMELPALGKKAEPLQPSSMQRMEKAYNKYLTAKRAVEELRYQASAARDALLQKVAELGSYFKQMPNAHLPFDEVAGNVSLFRGSLGRSLMDVISTRSGIKTASHAKASGIANWSKAPYATVDEAIAAANKMLDAQAAHIKASEALSGAEEALRPFGCRQEVRILPQPVKAGSFLTGALTGLAGRSLLGQPSTLQVPVKTPEEGVEEQWLQLENPAHDSEIRKIRTQAMLQDFMANDDVISGYDPDEVMTAYNELSQLAPRAAVQPAIMRPLLRRRLQGHMEPFEAGEAATIEKTLTQTMTPTPRTQRMLDAPHSILG